MKLITEQVLVSLRKSAEKTRKKYAHALLTKTIPVDVRVALELGLRVKDEAVAALGEASPETQVLTTVRLADYLQALEDYDKDESEKTPPTYTQGSNPYDDAIEERLGKRQQDPPNPWKRPNKPKANHWPPHEGSRKRP